MENYKHCYEFEQKGVKPPRVELALNWGHIWTRHFWKHILQPFEIFLNFFVLNSSCRPLFQEGKTASLPALGTMRFTSISLRGSCHICSWINGIIWTEIYSQILFIAWKVTFICFDLIFAGRKGQTRSSLRLIMQMTTRGPPMMKRISRQRIKVLLIITVLLTSMVIFASMPQEQISGSFGCN